MNFYDIGKMQIKFDVIIFGSSFMLMPDQLKALRIAKQNLNQNGSIFFMLTLYKQKNLFTKFMQVVKPYLKYLTTVDFGQVTYEQQFYQILKKNGLKVDQCVRAQGNVMLKLFKFYVVEASFD